jgi:hypothetical protein
MEIVSRCAPGCCVGDDAWPSTPSEIVGWEMGARTCLHVRPGRLIILECSFNKTTHHQEPQIFEIWGAESYLEIARQTRRHSLIEFCIIFGNFLSLVIRNSNPTHPPCHPLRPLRHRHLLRLFLCDLALATRTLLLKLTGENNAVLTL